MKTITVTKEDQKAIAALKRLAKKWPSGLMLFSWSGSLTVMKNGDMLAQVTTVDIPNDGGDPQYDQEVYWDSDIDLEYE